MLPSVSPIRFDPAFEKPAPDEAETIAQLVETMRSIGETTYKDSGRGLRTVHAKSHGLLDGELRVLDGLPEMLAQGAFAKSRTFPIIMRFSTAPGDVLDDSVSAPRGIALKIVGVEGERLPGAEGEVTQDFLMQNGPAFGVPDPKKFLGVVKLLAKTTDRAERLKKLFSAVLRGVETVLEAAGTSSPTVVTLGGQRATQILGDVFYTMVPVLYGPFIAKLSLAPVSPDLTALTKAPLNLNGNPNALRNSVIDFFSRRGGEWELRVQLCTDLAKMPIEDASVVWPESESPYVPVARVTVPRQLAWTEARAASIDDGMAFSPWHGLAAHRPVGGIMRARKPAYPMSAELRSRHNGCPLHEPRARESLPA